MNTVNDEAEVMCSGSMFQMWAPATGKSVRADGGQSDSRNNQVVGSREPEKAHQQHGVTVSSSAINCTDWLISAVYQQNCKLSHTQLVMFRLCDTAECIYIIGF